MATKPGNVVTYYKKLQSIKSLILWTRGHVRLLDKLKISYLHYHNTYDHTNLGGWLHAMNNLPPYSHMTFRSLGLVILISLNLSV